MRIPIVWDMETGDPDDFLTLLLLLDHPRAHLKAVTITPGAPDQVGLVRRALSWFGREDVVVGAYDLEHRVGCVSGWHYRAYGEAPPSREAERGDEVLLRLLDEETTLVTGAPPKNLGAALALGEKRSSPLRLGRWVAQGGFAGEGVVPPEQQLDKFRGLTICPSFNLNGAPQAVLSALAAPTIGARRFVSKNVCHGVLYDREMHHRFAASRTARQSIELIWKGMETYLQRQPAGKKFHDPLAAACALDESVGQWAEVELYREQGKWGSRLSPGSGTLITVGYHPERFIQTLLSPARD